jgi:shikimate kinase
VPADGRRPLAADRAQMERLFAVRQAAYAQAHVRIDAGAAPAEAIAEQIFDRIARM